MKKSLHNPTNLIYLFFIKEPLTKLSKSVNPDFIVESTAFMFQLYIQQKSKLKWEKMYHVFQDHAEDLDFGIELANLKYHRLLTDSGNLTREGVIYLKTELEEQKELNTLLNRFKRDYDNYAFLQGTELENKRFNSIEDFVPFYLPYKVY